MFHRAPGSPPDGNTVPQSPPGVHPSVPLSNVTIVGTWAGVAVAPIRAAPAIRPVASLELNLVISGVLLRCPIGPPGRYEKRPARPIGRWPHEGYDQSRMRTVSI